VRALRYDRYGTADVLTIAEMPEPSPAAGEFKIRVRAASLNPLDWKLRSGHLALVPVFDRPPRGIGVDFAGEIVGAGGGATDAWVGQRVFGALSPLRRQGAVSEFILARPSQFAAIPDGIDFDAAAALPVAAGTAVQALEDHAELTGGQRVLITAAAGGVGHCAVQFARHLGATVTAVCGPANADFVRELGAHEVIDYTRSDFLRSGDRYDVVFDAACSSDYFSCRAVLTAEGVYLNTGGSFSALTMTAAAALAVRVMSHHRVVPVAVKLGAPLWHRLARHAAAGVLKPLIARRIAMTDVAAAQRQMESGHGRGKIIVVMP
jgi:NADPH:quinone reductase-like Zn-dependent oxidoreductase